MDWTTVLNTSYCHRTAYEITNQIYKNTELLIGPDGVLQEGYIEVKTIKLEDNNVEVYNADAAQTKTKLPILKKQRIKHSPKLG